VTCCRQGLGNSSGHPPTAPTHLHLCTAVDVADVCSNALDVCHIIQRQLGHCGVHLRADRQIVTEPDRSVPTRTKQGRDGRPTFISSDSGCPMPPAAPRIATLRSLGARVAISRWVAWKASFRACAALLMAAG
jgi:hypothetical protein